MEETSLLILGASGQLGKALTTRYPGAKAVDARSLDISDPKSLASFDWSPYKVIINAAAYTNVDGAETPEGRHKAWQVNAAAVGNLVRAALNHSGLMFVHISTDYVFDGTKNPHTEDEAFSPISVYGASKAAADIAVSLLPKYYILRTSWVIGDGKNFVRTMLELGGKGVNPTVVGDQIGRLTFTTELVRAIDHLITSGGPSGTYNISNDGEPASWADIARKIFEAAGLPNTVSDTTSVEYFKNKPGAAPRPLQSTLDLSKIKATGFVPSDWHNDLVDYIKREKA